MLYGAELWTLCRHQANKLLATEIDLYGRQQGNKEWRKLENYECPTKLLM